MGFLFGSPSQQQSSSSSSMLSGNLAFPTIAQSTAPSLGLPSAAGSMMAQLLGIPGFGTNPSNPTTSPPPGSGVGGPITSPGGTYTPSPPIITPGTFGGDVGGIPGAYTGPPVPGTNPSVNGGLPYYPNTGTVQSDGGGVNDLGGTSRSFGGKTVDAMASNPSYAVGSAPLSPSALLGGANGPSPSIAGNAPTSSAGSALDDFSNSSGMDFIRSQGVKAIDASQAGKGMLNSGATGQALSDYGTNLGKTYLNNYLQDLGSLAGIGQNQTNSLVDAGRTMATSGTSSGTGQGGKPGLLGGGGLGSLIGGIASIGSLGI